MALNKTILNGRLTKEPKKVNDNLLIVTLAVEREYKNKDGVRETDFIDVWVSGKSLPLYENLEKGDGIIIEGVIRVIPDEYARTSVRKLLTDENMSSEFIESVIKRIPREKTIISADRLHFSFGRKQGATGAGGGAPASKPSDSTAQEQQSSDENVFLDGEDDLPF